MKQGRFPNTRWSWHRYYVARFNKFKHPEAAELAMTYLFLHLAFDEPETIGAVCTKEPSSLVAAPNADEARPLEAVSA